MYSPRGLTRIEIVVTVATLGIIASIAIVMGMAQMQRTREQARVTACIANLRQYGIAQAAYLDENDDRYPYAWTSLVKTEQPVDGYSRFCRWHDPRYPLDGPFWTYLPQEKIHVCPSFKILSKSEGTRHPSHDPSIPVIPQYSYSMNVWLGSKKGDPYGSAVTDSIGRGGVYKHSEITRSKSQVFFFAEENMWNRPGCNWVLNNNALCADGREWFGTFHRTSPRNLNNGTINAVFVDCHVQEVRSALKEDPSNRSEMEFGRFEKFAWPHKEPFQ